MNSPTRSVIDEVCRDLAQTLGFANQEDVAEPIRAGMRARAIAEGCERLAIPAVLVDASGRVLYVASAALPVMEGHVRVAAGCLVGEGRAANQALSRVLGKLLNGKEVSSGGRSLPIAGLLVNDASPYQLLHALLVFGDAGAAQSIRKSVLA